MLKSIIPFIFATITVLMFQTCGPNPLPSQNQSNNKIYTTDPAFHDEIQEFEYYHGSSVSHVPVTFADLSEKFAGMCYRSYLGDILMTARIEIDLHYWNVMSQIQRRNLIIHEFGHCVLQRGHVLSNSVSECPSSFMDDTVMSDYCLNKYYPDYIKEMFP